MPKLIPSLVESRSANFSTPVGLSMSESLYSKMCVSTPAFAGCPATQNVLVRLSPSAPSSTHSTLTPSKPAGNIASAAPGEAGAGLASNVVPSTWTLSMRSAADEHELTIRISTLLLVLLNSAAISTISHPMGFAKTSLMVLEAITYSFPVALSENNLAT